VARQADPEDGRASLLVATEAGLRRYSHHTDRRDVHFRQMLAGWSQEQGEQFAASLARFNEDFDSYKHIFLADITGQPSENPASREENE
jgi:DNA-binding MarR family transcriptional regulator